MSGLEAREICFSYGKERVLDGFSLTARPGECVVIAGANGCGKSTALAVLAGILKPDSGEVIPGGTVGYVPQKGGLMEDMTAKANLRFFSALAEKSVPAQLPMGVEGFLDKRVSKLSGGMKKRLSIACALVSEPDILLFDEPCEALDEPGRRYLRELIEHLKYMGKSIIYVGHDPEEFADFYDRLLLIKEGRGTAYLRSQLSGIGSREVQLSNLQRSYAQLFK